MLFKVKTVVTPVEGMWFKRLEGSMRAESGVQAGNILLHDLCVGYVGVWWRKCGLCIYMCAFLCVLDADKTLTTSAPTTTITTKILKSLTIHQVNGTNTRKPGTQDL